MSRIGWLGSMTRRVLTVFLLVCATLLGVAVGLSDASSSMLLVAGAVTVLGLGLVLAVASNTIQFSVLLAYVMIRPALEAARVVELGGQNPASIASVIVVAWGILSLGFRVRGSETRWGRSSVALWSALIVWSLSAALVVGKEAVAAPEVLRLLQYLVLALLAHKLVQEDSRRLMQLPVAMGMGLLAVAAVSVPSLVTQIPAAYAGLARVSGVFAHPNAMAFYCTVNFPILVWASRWLRGVGKWACTLAAGIAGLLVLLSGTRSAWLALVLVMMVLWADLGLRLVPATVLAGLGVALSGTLIATRMDNAFSSNPEVSSFGFRLRMLQAGSDLVSRHPLAGTGLGTFTQSISGLYVPLQAHNDYLRLLSETGVVGTTLWIGAVAAAAAACMWTYGRTTGPQRAFARAAIVSLAVILVGAASDNVITQGVLMGVVAVSVGAALGLASLPPDRHGVTRAGGEAIEDRRTD